MASQAEQLRLAASAGQAEKVRDLCKAGVKIDQDLEGRTALHLAAANGHLATVKVLINSGAKVNARDAAGYSPLHQSATEGHEEVVLLLLKSGCHVDTQDELHGNTALHEAAWKGYSRTLEVLCKHKANVYIKNNGGFTALHLACQNGHNQSCRVLLLAACKPDVRNSYGDTPLHTAARYGHAGVLRILISAFCAVSETNKNGDTALHISAAMGRRKLTKILMEAGCDQTIKNNQGETARDIAVRKDFSGVVEILDNPPVTLIPVPQKEMNGEKRPKRDSSKKRGKESGTSQDSSSKEKKEKSKKSKKKQSVHFVTDGKKNISPYGCHMYPDFKFFPAINLKSLPPEPLKKGEQYYADLAGNIKKGPRGLGYACYCAPFFDHVEKKLDANKQELLKHIDVKNEDLKSKLTHLEQRTHDQLFNLNQRMKESLALERAECSERIERSLLRERIELQNQQENGFQSLKTEMKSWVDQNRNHCQEFYPPLRNRTQHYHVQDGFPISRSRSADLLSDTDSHQWSTVDAPNGVAFRGRPISHRHNTFMDDYKYRAPDCSADSGARPKHARPLSPKLSRWKDRCYSNSMHIRDSRSEGDLTSCHNEAVDQQTDIKNGNSAQYSAKETSSANESKSQLTHVHKQDIYHKVKTESSGFLWNLKHLKSQKPLRTHLYSDHDHNIASSSAKYNSNSNANEFPKQHFNKPLLSTSENNSGSTSPSIQMNQANTEASAMSVNLLYRNRIPHHTTSGDARKENGSPSISIDADGSSFV